MAMEGGGTAPARRVMVVADPSRESAGALQWALSHAVVESDELVLLHIENAASWKSTLSTFLRKPPPPVATPTTAIEGSNELDFLEEMKRLSQASQAKVQVRIERVAMEGKDKAATILSQCHSSSVDLLVIGQRRSLSTAILGYRRGGGAPRGTRGIETSEYLIENSMCTCVGVQKKGQNAGYVLNTKTHKNFWLLA